MIDTGGTLCKAAEALKERGAKRVFAYATHLFSSNAVDNIKNSVIDEVIVCDTIPLSPEIKALKNVRTLTLSNMLAEAIRRISNERVDLCNVRALIRRLSGAAPTVPER